MLREGIIFHFEKKLFYKITFKFSSHSRRVFISLNKTNVAKKGISSIIFKRIYFTIMMINMKFLGARLQKQKISDMVIEAKKKTSVIIFINIPDFITLKIKIDTL